MRLFSIPPPTLLAGFLAVLIGYASSAAIIWQAAIVAGATTAQISGWMTALGLAMGVSTLTLTLWYRVPVLTAWSTPGAALLVTGLQGLTLNEAIGVFIVTNALIVLCGITGLFARLMRIIPHSLAAAMLAGILLRFGLQAFASLDGQFTLCGSMLLVWLATKAVAPRYAVIAAMIIGIVIVIAQGDVVTTDVVFKPVLPTYITPDFSFAHSLSVALPLFLVTMASQNAPGIAAMKAAGYSTPVIYNVSCVSSGGISGCGPSGRSGPPRSFSPHIVRSIIIPDIVDNMLTVSILPISLISPKIYRPFRRARFTDAKEYINSEVPKYLTSDIGTSPQFNRFLCFFFYKKSETR